MRFFSNLRFLFQGCVISIGLLACGDGNDGHRETLDLQSPTRNAAFVSGCEPFIPEDAGPLVSAEYFRGTFGSFNPERGCQYEWPEPYLSSCTEPLIEGAPDLRGLWADVQTGYTERVEQCGNLVIIVGERFTHGGYTTGNAADGVNDYRADGTCSQPIAVALSYADDSLLFQVGGIIVVTRSLEVAEDGEDELVWRYGPGLPETARMRRYCNLSVVP
jgi:hypothetical protein